MKTPRLINLFFQYSFIVFLSLFSFLAQAAPEQVSIQLKWTHSFQFAGYYAAIEKGFYRDAGLEVTLKEIDHSRDFVEQVISGESEYGISDSTLLIYHLQGKPVVLLNQFFQHSPLVFLSHRDSGIVSPYEMAGKKVAYNVSNQGDASLNALLLNTLGDLTKITQAPMSSQYYQEFIDGKIDVISAYSTSEPFLFKEQGVDVNIINPQSYGIDHYGDNLFTSQKELDAHPERVEKMSQATIKGWQYALDHPDEIIQLIRNKYDPTISVEKLEYEARSTRQMILPELVELGSVDPKRYQQAAEDYQRLGFVKSGHVNKHFFYNQSDQLQVKLTVEEQNWIKVHPEVSVGGLSDWAPFDFVNSDGQYSGVANDFLSLIAKNTGLTFKVSIDLWSNQLQKIRAKEIDLLGAAFYTKERSKFVNYSTQYAEALNFLFVRDDLDVKTLEDLDGKRVAIPDGFAHEELIKEHYPKLQIVTVDSFGDAVDAVLENRADLLFDNYAVISYALKKESINTIIPFKSTRKIGNNSVHILTRKGAPELASIIQKGLDSISDQEKQIIYNKWLGKQDVAVKHNLKLTSEEQQWLHDHKIIRLAAESNWPPFEFIRDNGDLQGFTADLSQLIENRLGIKFEVVSQFSWAKSLEKIRDHEIDMVGGIVVTPKRQQYLNFTSGYFKPPTAIYTRKNSAEITSLNDLAKKTVAVEDQYSIHERLAADYPEIILLPVTSTVEALTAVSHSKADAYIGNQGAANWLVSENALTNLRIVLTNDSELESRSHRFAVRDDWNLLPAILDKVLASISAQEMSSLRHKWFGAKASTSKALVLSQKEQQWLDQHKVIRFAGDPNWLPYEAFDQQGNYIGIVADHLKIIEQQLGVKLEIIQTDSWSESVEKVKQGEIDVLSESTDSELGSILSFTDNYLSSPIIIVMTNNEDYVEGISQIKQRKIAVIKDYGYIPGIIKNYPDLNIHYVDTIKDGLTAVSTGKVDALLATLAQASYHITDLGVSNVRIVGKTEFSTKLAFGMSKEFTPLIPLFNRALQSISPGRKQAILSNWGKDKFATKIDYDLLIKMAALFALITLIILYWNRKLTKEVGRRKEAEDQTQALFDNIPLHILVTTPDGRLLEANPQALNDYKIDKDELDQFNIANYYQDQKDREDIIKEISLNGSIHQKIVPFIQIDGSIRSMMLSIIPIKYQNQPSFLSISVDMNERIEYEKALEKAREQADSANAAKSIFLTNMSHELRTPLNAILGYAQLLQKDNKISRDNRQVLQVMNRSGEHLLDLINSVLDMSKIEAGHLELNVTDFDLHAMLDDLEVMLSIRTENKGLQLSFKREADVPRYVSADQGKLRQILINLLGNAIKFTEQGAIKLITSVVENENEPVGLRFEIVDTGIGIPAGKLSALFKPFFQVEGERQMEGTGLGLAISQQIARLMGGDIRVESQLDKGSRFFINVLLEHSSEDQLETRSQVKPVVGLAEDQDIPEVLIVDDNDTNRDFLIRALAPLGFPVKEAIDGLQAVEIFKTDRSPVVLMDVVMPRMNGIDATRAIRALPGGQNAIIIAVTASALDSEMTRIRNEGADAVVSKPVILDELLNTIAELANIELVFDEQADQQYGTIGNDNNKNTHLLPEHISDLPIELKEQISTALRAGKITQLRELIVPVTEWNESVGVAFETMVTGFKLAELKQLFSPEN